MGENKKSQVVIKDACILFDLFDLSLLKAFFQLDIIALTTSQVINEVKEVTQRNAIEPFLINGQLALNDEGTFDVIQRLFENYPALSITDCSILELANRTNGVLLSSDGSLRKIATQSNIKVRGTIWIIEELLRNEIIDGPLAVKSLTLYDGVNQRAPSLEIQKAIKRINSH